MIEHFTNHIIHSNEPYIIFDIGSRDCLQSIEFYKKYPNAHIYAFECNPNTLDICRKNIVSYADRITLIEGAVCDYDGDTAFICACREGNLELIKIIMENSQEEEKSRE